MTHLARQHSSSSTRTQAAAPLIRSRPRRRGVLEDQSARVDSNLVVLIPQLARLRLYPAPPSGRSFSTSPQEIAAMAKLRSGTRNTSPIKSVTRAASGLDAAPDAADGKTKEKARPKAQLRPAKVISSYSGPKSQRRRRTVSERELRSLHLDGFDRLDSSRIEVAGAGSAVVEPSTLAHENSQAKTKQEPAYSLLAGSNHKRTRSTLTTVNTNDNHIRLKKQRSGTADPIRYDSSDTYNSTRLSSGATSPPKSALARVRPKSEAGLHLKAPKIEEGLERECAICAEWKPIQRDFPSFKPCVHLPETCIACITQQTITKLETSGTWASCTCAQCGLTLPQAQLTATLSAKDLTRAKALVFQHTQRSHPAWRWCVAADCDGGQLHLPRTRSQKRSLIVVCNKCGVQSCFYHRVPWHTGYTCEEFDDSHPAAQTLRTSEERIKRISKACPGVGCGRRVQKDGGCDHMWCKSLPKPSQHSVVGSSVRTAPDSKLGSYCGTAWDWASVEYEYQEWALPAV